MNKCSAGEEVTLYIIIIIIEIRVDRVQRIMGEDIFLFLIRKNGVQLKISYNYIHEITALIIMHIGMQVKVYS